MVEADGFRLDGGSAREPIRRGELMNMVAGSFILRGGSELRGEGSEALEGRRHCGRFDVGMRCYRLEGLLSQCEELKILYHERNMVDLWQSSASPRSIPKLCLRACVGRAETNPLKPGDARYDVARAARNFETSFLGIN